MITYDLHVHTCLSPCADDNMTPVKVIDKAVENGLDVVAITDHNTIDNLAVAAEYAEGKIAFVPGIEVESAEEVHVVCLFPDMISAERMARCVRENMHTRYNNAKKFGNQNIVDENDKVVDTEEKMLRFPTKMTIEEIFYVAKQMHGVAFYAHVESKGYSVLSVLGALPARPQAKALEFTNNEKGRAFAEKQGNRYKKLFIYSSDAHRLEDINTKENSVDLEEFADVIRDENGAVTAQGVIDWIRSYDGV